jgi:hypothetical protein
VSWDVPGIGGFSYGATIALARDDGKWRVDWSPADVHPRLRGRSRLGTVRQAPPRAPILDRDGRPLVMARQVVRVGIDRAKVRDVDATAAELADVLKIDGGKLARAARRAGPKQFVEALTLRNGDYQPLAERLKAIQGVQAIDGTAQLAPTRSFARALLGAVAPATAEQVQRAHGAIAAGDDVGQWGLEARFQSRLAGTSTRRIVIRGADGVPTATLMRRTGKKGQALRTTLDRDVQQAAETALGARRDKAAVVAMQPSTGDVLAVANRPTDQTFDRAIDGRYPPGSTFKVISTAALLRDGLKTTDIVECPRTITIAGKQFRNFEGEAGGAVPFSVDFAQSCNTAFVSLAKRLPADALSRTARDFGLGRTRASQVPAGTDAVERAAAMIGQARIVASPLAMAGVAPRGRADDAAHAHAQRGDVRHRDGAGRRPRRGRRQDRDGRVRRWRPAADPRLVHRLPRRPRGGRTGREGPLGRHGRRADRAALLRRAAADDLVDAAPPLACSAVAPPVRRDPARVSHHLRRGTNDRPG